jgi:hypothetical protein
MSTMALGEGHGGVVAAWETSGQIYFAPVQRARDIGTRPQAPPGDGGNRKHPTLAFGARGEMLLAWTEGTGWQQGGALAWQVFDRNGKPTSDHGTIAQAIPVWGLPTAVAIDGRFTIIY